MKKIITTILLILLVGCQRITVTVLEVNTLRTSSADITHRITYVQSSRYAEYTTMVDFYSLLGVKNFLNEVADVDLSQWESVK